MGSFFVQISKNPILRRRWYFWLSLVVLTVCALWSWINFYRAEYFEAETALQYRGTQQVFFDDGTGIREELSHREYIEETFSYVRYRFPMLVENPVMIRVDPVDVSGWVKFKRLAIKPKWSWKHFPLIDADVPKSGIAKLHFDDEQQVWTSYPERGNSDPFIVLTDLPVQASNEAVQKHKIVSLLSLVALVVIGSILIEWLFRVVIGNVVFKTLRFLIKISSKRWFAGIACLLCGGISVYLVWAMIPDKNERLSHVSFEWKGYPTEFIQLDYDFGDGFHLGQSRLFYNQEKQSTFIVDFRLPDKSIKRMRMTVQRGNQPSVIGHIKINGERFDANGFLTNDGAEVLNQSTDQLKIHPSESLTEVSFEMLMAQ